MKPGDPHEMFTTARLRVRWLTRADYDAMFAVYSDPVGVRYVDDGQPISPDDCARWIELTISRYETHGYGMSAAVSTADGRVVGFAGLVHPGGQVLPELKYALRSTHWGKGVATELAQGMMRHAREVLDLTEVIATVDPAHTASRRVLAKAGLAFRSTRIEDDGLPTEVWGWSVA